MKGLPPKTLPLRVAVLADDALVEALSDHAEQMILSPVETNLEISARVTQADVLVVDASKQSAEAFKTIHQLTYKRPVLALVNHGQSAEAFRAGAKGVVRRDSSPLVIAAAIAALHRGLIVTDVAAPSAGQLGPEAPPHEVSAVPAGTTFTKRENEVLIHLADGLSNKQIAAQLGISEHTAKFHVNSILQKMNAQKRVEAVVRAAKLGLIHL